MRAEACGLDIARVHGTGPDGLVIERDVLAAEASSRAVGQVQRAGAPAADAYYVEVDMQQCMQMRTLLREAELPVAFSDLLVCCAAKALARFPALNAALGEDGALEQRPINIGLLVALEEDAPAVVIPQADRMCLADISDRVHALVQRAADGSLDDEDRQGDTFTIANAGILGVDGFVTTSRNAALCAGRIKWRAVVVEGGAIEARPTMWLSLTCDPRVVSGTIPARFLATVKTMLESPALLLA